MLSINSIINKSIKSDRKAKILTFYYDGIFDIMMAETGHEFYGVYDFSSYDWSHLKNIIPNNLHLVSPEDLFKQDYDLIVVSNREKNLQNILNYQTMLQLPIIVIDQEPSTRNKFVSSLSIDKNAIPIATYPKIATGYGHKNCIMPGFKSRNKTVKDLDVCIIGNFIESDYPLLEKIKGKYKTILIGNNPGLNSLILNNVEDLNSVLDNSRIYLNLGTKLNVDCLCFKALASHCNVITNNVIPMNEILSTINGCAISEVSKIVDNIDIVLNNLKEITYVQNDFIGQFNSVINSQKEKIWIN